MADPVDVMVFNVPGLSARMLAENEADVPAISKLARAGTAATVVVLDGASPQQLETALFTGLLPEYSNARPFWLAADIPASVQPQYVLPAGWAAFARKPRLQWITHDWLDDPAGLQKLDAAVRDVGPDRAVALLSAWVQPGHTPLDRPVLITRGIEQAKTCVGILEIAGILQRALTGERVTDAI